MEPPAPPSTRRSHPDLTHHHPLTPSALPARTHLTSRSTSYLSPTLPLPTPSILSSSRSPSRARLRPLTSRPVPVSSTTPAKGRSKKPTPAIEDDGWLLRTASILAEQRMEEKGQSWLATRSSSTSLTAGLGELEGDDEASAYYTPSDPRTRNTSCIQTPVASRSRLQSRATSRRGSVFSSAQPGESEGARKIKPDFVDLAAEDEVDMDVADLSEDEDEEEVDEGEMRRVIMARLGGWVDWAVGWMDFRDLGDATAESDDVRDGAEDGGGGDEGDATEESREVATKGDEPGGNVCNRADGEERRQKRKAAVAGEVGGEKGVIVQAPEGDVGVLRDARWLLEVASKVAF